MFKGDHFEKQDGGHKQWSKILATSKILHYMMLRNYCGDAPAENLPFLLKRKEGNFGRHLGYLTSGQSQVSENLQVYAKHYDLQVWQEQLLS